MKKKFKSLIAGAIISAAVAVAAPAQSVDSNDNRALGGLDFLVDNYQPANAALNTEQNPSLTFKSDISVDSGALKLIDQLHGYLLFRNFRRDFDEQVLNHEITPEQGIEQLLDIKRFAEGEGATKGKINLAQFNWRIVPGTNLLFGAYLDGEMNVQMAIPNIDVSMWKPDHLDFGSDFDLVRAKARIDAGVNLGFGQKINLPGNGKLSLGVQNKGFYRMNLENFVWEMERLISYSYQLYGPGFIPAQGFGYGLDVYANATYNDPLFNTKLGLEVENAISRVWWVEGSPTRDELKLNAGILINPLYFLGNKNWTLGFEAEDIFNPKPEFQLGTSYDIGNRELKLTPKLGLIINDKDFMGNLSTILTAGATLRIDSYNLTGMYEYNTTSKQHTFGITSGIRNDF